MDDSLGFNVMVVVLNELNYINGLLASSGGDLLTLTPNFIWLAIKDVFDIIAATAVIKQAATVTRLQHARLTLER